MAMQQVEYEFPDEKSENLVEVEVKETEKAPADVEVEPAVGRHNIDTKPQKVTQETEEIEIEVEDDTPEEDRGKVAIDPPDDVTDEELESYSSKVKKRISRIQRSYHDERRAKEQAQRELDQLAGYAKQLVDENKKLKGSETKSHNAMIEQAKKQVESELLIARREYKDAYESGDSNALIVAQEAMNRAQIKADKVNSMRPRSLQQEEKEVQQQSVPPEPEKLQQPQPVRDEKLENWRDQNSWFGPDGDVEMTAYALGYHSKLVSDGVDPQSNEYYEKIDSRMRKMFPDHFDDGIDEPEEPRKKSSNVVAPATRSTGPKKIRLKQSEIAIARKLGVPLSEYALEAAKLGGNKNG